MAENKKSVLLYCDIIHTVTKLSDENAGKLFKHYLRYINDKNPKPENEIIDLVFEPIKQNLKRDLKKWNGYIEKQRLNGAKGGRPKTQKTQAFILKPKKGVIVKDIVKDKVIVKDINKRKSEFKNSLSPFLCRLTNNSNNKKYSDKLIKDFFDYWSEHNEKGKKMRFEYVKNQPFNVSRRLGTFFKNSKKWGKEKSIAKKEKVNAGELIQQVIKNSN